MACCALLADAVPDAEPVAEAGAMLRFTIQQVSSDEDLAFKTGILSPQEKAQWLRKAAIRRGVEFRSLPCITARLDQEGTLEVIREMIAPTFERSWMGVTAKVRGKPNGQRNEVSVNYEHRLLTLYGREDSIDMNANHPEFKVADFKRYWAAHQSFPLKTRKAAIAEVVPDGFTVVKRTGGTSARCEFVLVTAERVDATGRPIRQRE